MLLTGAQILRSHKRQMVIPAYNSCYGLRAKQLVGASQKSVFAQSVFPLKSKNEELHLNFELEVGCRSFLAVITPKNRDVVGHF